MTNLETLNWRNLVSEEDQDQLIGQLVRKQSEAEKGFATVDAQIKQIGDRLEGLGSALRSTVAGGDYRDLLNPLKNIGVGVSAIDVLLTKRNSLASEIADCKSRLAQLKI